MAVDKLIEEIRKLPVNQRIELFNKLGVEFSIEAETYTTKVN